MPPYSADPIRVGCCAGCEAMGRPSSRASSSRESRWHFEVGSGQLDVVEWQGGGVLDGLQGEAGTDVLELHGRNQPLVDRIVGIDVGDDYPHQVVDIAAHPVDLGHL